MTANTTKRICIVLDYGWIVEGKVVERGEMIRLEDASVVRRWMNGRGIGAIADPSHKDEYELDAIGDVDVYARRVLFEIPMRW